MYGKLLKEKISQEGSKCWLVNTGWTGGSHGVGKRFDIPTTRRVVNAIQNGELEGVETETIPGLNLEVPLSVEGVKTELLTPRDTWPVASDYDEQAKKLIKLFADNFERYKNLVDETILAVAL